MAAEAMRQRLASMPPCHLNGQHPPPAGQGRPLIRLRLVGETEAVRGALQRVSARLAADGVGQDAREVAELALAEAMNNIVEHAFADRPGLVALDIDRCAAGLRVTLRDNGRRMPRSTLPPGTLPACGTCTDDLPEGGFGWFLIHALARNLSYRRIGSCNRLHFLLPEDEGGNSAAG